MKNDENHKDSVGIQGCHPDSLKEWIVSPQIGGQRACRLTLTMYGETGQTATGTSILGKHCTFKVEDKHEGSIFF
jgi:hypothetical protein